MTPLAVVRAAETARNQQLAQVTAIRQLHQGDRPPVTVGRRPAVARQAAMQDHPGCRQIAGNRKRRQSAPAFARAHAVDLGRVDVLHPHRLARQHHDRVAIEGVADGLDLCRMDRAKGADYPGPTQRSTSQ